MHLSNSTRLEQDCGGLLVLRILGKPVDVLRYEPAQDVVRLHRHAVLAEAVLSDGRVEAVQLEGVGVAGVAEALEGVAEVLLALSEKVGLVVLPVGPDVLYVARIVFGVERLVADLKINTIQRTTYQDYSMN